MEKKVFLEEGKKKRPYPLLFSILFHLLALVFVSLSRPPEDLVVFLEAPEIDFQTQSSQQGNVSPAPPRQSTTQARSPSRRQSGPVTSGPKSSFPTEASEVGEAYQPIRSSETRESGPSRIQSDDSFEEREGLLREEALGTVPQEASSPQGQTGSGTSGPISWKNQNSQRRAIYIPAFQMPASLQGKGINEEIVADFKVDSNGVVMGVTIVQGSAWPGLDRAVEENLKRYRFNAVAGGVVSAGTFRYLFRGGNLQ